MAKYRIIILIIIVLISGRSSATPLSWKPVQNVDSLKALLQTVSGAQRVDVLNELCYALHKTAAEEGYEYTEQALALAVSLDYNEGKATAYWMLSFKYNTEYSNAGSIKYLKLGLASLDSTTHWTIKLRILSKLGRRYSNINLTDSSLLYFNQIIDMNNSDSVPWHRTASYLSITSELYNLKKDYINEEKTLRQLYELVIQNFKSCENIKSFGMMSYLEKLGRFYNRHGNYYKAVHSYKRVTDSIPKFELLPLEKFYFEAKFLGHTGRAYGLWGKFEESVKYHNLSLIEFKKGWEVFNNPHHPDYSDKISDWEINIANQQEGKATIQTWLGLYKNAESNFDTSIILREKWDDHLGIAMCYDVLGELNQLQGKFQKAKAKYDSSLIMKKRELKRYIDKYGYFQARVNYHINSLNEYISTSYLKLGNLYLDWGKPLLALDYLQKSFETSDQINYTKGKAEALMMIGNVYFEVGKTELALSNNRQSLILYQEIDFKPGIAEGYVNLAKFHFKNNNISNAERFYHQALEIFEQLQMQQKMAEIYSSLAEINFKKNDLENAENRYLKSISIASELNLQKTLIASHKGLSDLYTTTGNTDQAFYHYKKFIAAKDSVYSYEANKHIAEIEARFESKKREQQIHILEHENELREYRIERSNYIMISLGGLSLLLVLAAILFIHQERLKASQKNLLLQQRLLRTQMNPHFIFNSLANIQSFMFMNETQKANKYLTRFSTLLRNILESSRGEYITLSKELESIENYLELQKLRFLNKFDYQLEIDDNIETDLMKIPPMLTQPFIENCIEHGIQHKQGSGNILVKLSLTETNVIQFLIEDDGIGRDRALDIIKKQNRNHKSLATEITRDRLRILNKKLKNKITMNVIDLKDESNQPTGTRVLIDVPVEPVKS